MEANRNFVTEYFSAICSDEDFLSSIQNTVQMVMIPAGKTILEAGEKSDYVALVASGLVRGFWT